MEITNKFLKKVFAISGIFLYALGFTACHIKSASDYVRVLDNVPTPNYVIDPNRDDYGIVHYYYCSLNTAQSTGRFVYNSTTYNIRPVFHLDLTFNADRDYSYGEGILSFYDADNFDANSCYLDYYGENAIYNYWFSDIGDYGGGSNIWDILYPNGYSDLQTRSLSFETYFFVNGSTDKITFQLTFKCVDTYAPNTVLATDYLVNRNDFAISELDFNWSFEFRFAGGYCLDSISIYNVIQLAKTASDGYATGYNEGVLSVLNNPHSYSLYDYSDYLAYGTAKYNEGVEAGSNVLSMAGLVNEIFKAPITMFTGIFNSDAFQWRMPTGEILDIGGLMTFLLTIGIALAIVRLIMKVGGK